MAPENRTQVGAPWLPHSCRYVGVEVRVEGGILNQYCVEERKHFSVLTVRPEPRSRKIPPSHHSPPSAARTKRPPVASQTTPPPDIRNTTMPPHSGKGEAGRWTLMAAYLLLCGVYAAAFALRRGSGSGAGSRVGHGSDRSHPRCGLCSTLEEQVRPRHREE